MYYIYLPCEVGWSVLMATPHYYHYTVDRWFNLLHIILINVALNSCEFCNKRVRTSLRKHCRILFTHYTLRLWSYDLTALYKSIIVIIIITENNFRHHQWVNKGRAKPLKLQQLDCHWGEVLTESRPRLHGTAMSVSDHTLDVLLDRQRD